MQISVGNSLETGPILKQGFWFAKEFRFMMYFLKLKFLSKKDPYVNMYSFLLYIISLSVNFKS